MFLSKCWPTDFPLARTNLLYIENFLRSMRPGFLKFQHNLLSHILVLSKVARRIPFSLRFVEVNVDMEDTEASST